MVVVRGRGHDGARASTRVYLTEIALRLAPRGVEPGTCRLPYLHLGVSDDRIEQRHTAGLITAYRAELWGAGSARWRRQTMGSASDPRDIIGSAGRGGCAACAGCLYKSAGARAERGSYTANAAPGSASETSRWRRRATRPRAAAPQSATREMMGAITGGSRSPSGQPRPGTSRPAVFRASSATPLRPPCPQPFPFYAHPHLTE